MDKLMPSAPAMPPRFHVADWLAQFQRLPRHGFGYDIPSAELSILIALANIFDANQVITGFTYKQLKIDSQLCDTSLSKALNNLLSRQLINRHPTLDGRRFLYRLSDVGAAGFSDIQRRALPLSAQLLFFLHSDHE